MPTSDPRKSRRDLLRLTVWLGAGLGSAGILAACGGGQPVAPAASSATKASTASSAASSSASSASSAASATTSAAASKPASTSAVVGKTTGKVLVRNPGGAYEEAWRKVAYEPFTAETGIEVVPVATNAAKILAMVQSGNIELDMSDMGEYGALLLQRANALEKVDTSKFKLTNIKDVDPVNESYVGNIEYSYILAYNTKSFPTKHPTNWAEFWDVNTFPGPRILQDLGNEMIDLEMALLADGVPMDKLYPIDLDRAFKKLQQIRKSIVKWYDTSGLPTQMFADNQAVLGSAPNGRVQVVIDGGAPVAIEWNQAKRVRQVFCILKKAPNTENAYRLLDYSLQPKVMAEFAKRISYGPANRKAFEFLDEKTAAKLPTSPEHLKNSFVTNMTWWVDNQKVIADRWQEFLLAK